MTDKTVNPGFRDMNAKMDAHVRREDNRATPRRTRSGGRDKKGRFDKSQPFPVTDGVRVKRGEIVVYPYGGKPMETIVRPLSAKQQERKRTIARQIDQIGKQVVRESSRARKGCALVTVAPAETMAFAFKLRAALKGGQVRDTDTNASNLAVARSRRVLAELQSAANAGTPVTLGVYTRAELKIIGSQRINAKHYTRHVRNLEAKLAGNR